MLNHSDPSGDAKTSKFLSYVSRNNFEKLIWTLHVLIYFNAYHYSMYQMLPNTEKHWYKWENLHEMG